MATTARRMLTAVRTRAREVAALARGDVSHASPERFVKTAYRMVLRREGDPAGVANYTRHLRRGTLSTDGVLDEMLTSMELRTHVPYQNVARSLHLSRCDFVRLLPRARRILDLGGTDQDDPSGSLVSMGYPYHFERLMIVDLPHDERHDIYRHSASVASIETMLGPVEYRYHSMTDLSAYDDASFDLVFCGEAIEHVTEPDARQMLHEVRRVLEPAGWFALDTPNRRATELQLGEALSNPDHELEYTHTQLSAMLTEAGFEITSSYGLAYVGESFARGVFDTREVARNHGAFAAIDDCYLLAYICRVRAA